MSVQQKLFESLTVLGASADEVALRLGAMGFQGTPLDPADDPVARYLREALRTRHITVENHVCRIGPVSFPLPPPVVAFISAFDDGMYPALVDDRLTHMAGCPAEPDHCTCPR